MPSESVIAEPIEILLVEDNPGDVRLAMEALRRTRSLEQPRFRCKLSVVEDGVEAMSFLRREGEYGDAVRPDIILLDLNLPGKDGREVLAEIKSDKNLRRIPVIVLTMSDAELDILKCYDLGANSYIVKPCDFNWCTSVVRSVQEYWTSVVKLPPR